MVPWSAKYASALAVTARVLRRRSSVLLAQLGRKEKRNQKEKEEASPAHRETLWHQDTPTCPRQEGWHDRTCCYSRKDRWQGSSWHTRKRHCQCGTGCAEQKHSVRAGRDTPTGERYGFYQMPQKFVQSRPKLRPGSNLLWLAAVMPAASSCHMAEIGCMLKNTAATSFSSVPRNPALDVSPIA